MASMAANFLSTWGSERGAPECSTQLSSGGTPHVGQRTEDTCLGVSSFFFIRRDSRSLQYPVNVGGHVRP
jgi:hypothetical protein